MFYLYFQAEKKHFKHKYRVFRINIAYLTGSEYLRNAYLSKQQIKNKKNCEPPLKKSLDTPLNHNGCAFFADP